MSRALRFYAVYTTVVGVLLLFPSLAASIFAYSIRDAAVISGWGVALITTGLLGYAVASDVTKYGGLTWIFVLGLLLSAVDLLYYWLAGAYTARNVLAPVAINIALAGWIWTQRLKA